MTSAFSWQNSISLCPASFRILRPDLPVTPGVSWVTAVNPGFPRLVPVIKKQRHYFANRGLSSQGYGFSSGMYGFESWTVKKAERLKN